MTYNVDKNGKDKDANVEEHCITCTKTPVLPPTNFVNKRKGRKPMSENAEDDDE